MIILLVLFFVILLLCLFSYHRKEGYIEVPQPQNDKAAQCRAECNSYVDSFVCTFVPPQDPNVVPYPLPAQPYLGCDKNFILGQCYKRCPPYQKVVQSQLTLMQLLSDPFEALNEV